MVFVFVSSLETRRERYIVRQVSPGLSSVDLDMMWLNVQDQLHLALRQQECQEPCMLRGPSLAPLEHRHVQGQTRDKCVSNFVNDAKLVSVLFCDFVYVF